MEFYVIKGKVTFTNLNKDRVSYGSHPNIITARHAGLEEPLLSGSATNCVGELTEECCCTGNSFRGALMKVLTGWETERVRLSNRLSVNVSVIMTSTKTAHVEVCLQGCLEVLNEGGVKELRGYQVFERLKSALLPNSFEWNLNLKVDLTDLEPQLFEEKNCYGLEMAGMEITEDVWSKWDHTRGSKEDIELEGEISLTLRLDHSAVTKLYLESLGGSANVTTLPRNLIIEGVGSDLVVLAGGEKDKEKGMKCHKKILAERSPVFMAMFQADMSESKDNCLEIADMTEAGVRAMLQFIYAKDLEEASKKCEIALELMEGGHKYGMEDLEDAMMHLIWVKPVEWVSVDVALKMLFFSRKIGGKFEKIEKTSLVILKWYAQKSGSLMASEEYQRLHLEYPEEAMELGESFLSI